MLSLVLLSAVETDITFVQGLHAWDIKLSTGNTHPFLTLDPAISETSYLVTWEFCISFPSTDKGFASQILIQKGNTFAAYPVYTYNYCETLSNFSLTPCERSLLVLSPTVLMIGPHPDLFHLHFILMLFPGCECKPCVPSCVTECHVSKFCCVFHIPDSRCLLSYVQQNTVKITEQT